MKIFVVGYPSYVGGADTELWHTTRIWRDHEHEVSFIPTWHADPEWKQKLADIGCETHHANPATLDKVSGLPGGVVVSFCNAQFLKLAPRLRKMGCRLVWLNCMTWAFADELAFVTNHGPFDAHVYQSTFQRQQLEPQYATSGQKGNGVTKYDASIHGVQIRGAFDVSAWRFAPLPHIKRMNFCVGRLARDDPDKWSSNTWPIYERIQYSGIHAWLMGVNEKVYAKIGPPPHWATTLPANAISAAEFYRKLHCLMPINGGARENWPRVGLEAMAAGVPIVTHADWGWREMIRHGETGYLASDDFEFAHWAATLAHDEPLRLRIARQAREALAQELANPERIGQQWNDLFTSLESQHAQPIAATA